jgi:Fe-S cluster biogenesis protein NfuA
MEVAATAEAARSAKATTAVGIDPTDRIVSIARPWRAARGFGGLSARRRCHNFQDDPPMTSTDPRPRELWQRIEAVLDQHIRPGLRADGGDVEVVGIDDDKIVQVRMQGACQACPSSVMTLTMGIEATLKRHIPEIRFLEAVP